MTPLPTIFGYDLELLFATAVLRLKSLHYGFWDVSPDRVTLTSLREAQTRFTERLMELVPGDANTVLDVGAGIGDNAQALARRGLEVTAISPDRAHSKYFKKLRGKGITYLRTRFEHLDIDDRFDVVFICEALNYFDRRIGLQQCRRYLKRDGHLLIAAMFRCPETETYPDTFAVANLEYVALAQEYGFTLLATRDVTAHVLPTMEYAHRWLTRYVFPIIRTFSRGVSCTPGWLQRTAFGRKIDRIDEIRSYYELRINPEYFRTHIRYVFLLLGRGDATTAGPAPH